MKRKIKPSIILVILSVWIAARQSVFAQPPKPDLFNNILPPAPNAASLGKYIDQPIGLFTGTADIAIDFGEAKGKQLTVPLSLSYHSAGVKVEEISGWVGSGWTLNAGGVITRCVMGMPDELSFGYMNIPTSGGMFFETDATIPFTPSANFKYEIAIGNALDLQPDIFYYNFNGRAGKFTLDNKGNVLQMPQTGLKIVYSASLRSFDIITEDGSTYRFQNIETSWGSFGYKGFLAKLLPYTSSWYLTQILTPDNSDTITFEYSMPLAVSYDLKIEESFLYNKEYKCRNTYGTDTYAYSTRTDNVIFLTAINTVNQRIEFTANTNRLDFGGKLLDNIIFKNKTGDVYDKYDLSYLYDNHTPTPYRVFLEKITEKDKNGNAKPPYVFTYNNLNALPARNSMAQDHWGYYNGAVANTTLIPTIEFTDHYLNGANREPNAVLMQSGILTKITYPLGGTTEFTYEPNTYGYSGDFPVDKTVYQTQDSVASVWINYNQTGTGPCPGQTPPGGSVPNQLLTTFDIGFSQIITIESKICAQPAFGITRLELINNTNNNTQIYTYGSNSNNGIGGFISETKTMRVEPGHYTLKASSVGMNSDYGRLLVYWKKMLSSSIQNSFMGGGLRVSQIKHNDGVNFSQDLISSYSYTWDTSGRSSGVVEMEPVYQTNQQSSGSTISCQWGEDFPCPPQPFYPVADNTRVVRLTSSSQSNLGSTKGNYVGYHKVTTKTTGHGSTVQYFSTDQDIRPLSALNLPATSVDWRKGLLEREREYDETGKMRKERVLTYNEIHYTSRKKTRGMKIIEASYHFDINNGQCFKGYDQFGSTFLGGSYETLSESYGILKEIVSDYGSGSSAPLITTTDYFYDNPASVNVTRKVTKDSQGDEYTEQTIYPQDYAIGSNASGMSALLSTMKNKNMIAMPVEKIIWLKKNGSTSSQVIDGTLNTVKANGSFIVKDKEQQLKFGNTFSSQAQPVNPFTASFVNSANGQFTFDSHYDVLNSFSKYDGSNNLVEAAGRDNYYALIRNPNNGDVWAKATHAAYNEIAYSGFEQGNVSSVFTNWNYSTAGIVANNALSGQKAYNLSAASITTVQTLSAAQKFKISFWARGGTANVTANGAVSLRQGPTRNGWTYYEGSIVNAGSIQISGSALIDELRLYPQSARLTSYTYKEAIGLISECNENNQCTFYEYDDFNRLKLVRDQDGNILKKNEYQYQQIQN